MTDKMTRVVVHALNAAFLLLCLPKVFADDLTLEQLVAEIERQEAHYAELEYVATMNSERSPEPEVNEDASIEDELSSEERVEYWVRDGRWRFHVEETSHYFLTDSRRTFDGVWDGTRETTLAELKVTNVVSGEVTTHLQRGYRFEVPRTIEAPMNWGGGQIIRPHMALVYQGIGEPLSKFLAGRGGDDEGRDSYSNEAAIDMGDADWNGLRCRVLSVERMTDDGRRIEFARLWLAYERNLIPVHVVIFGEHEGEVIPNRRSTVLEWHEVESDIFFPQRVHIDDFSTSITHDYGREIVYYSRDWVIESISLACDCPDEDFVPPVFPEGIEVIAP